jgi:hypothetical protein
VHLKQVNKVPLLDESKFVGFEALTSAVVTVAIFWDAVSISQSVSHSHRRFGA